MRYLSLAEGLDLHRHLIEQTGGASGLREMGVFDVPAYLVEDDLFLGRQHLPMIRWLLTGRRGPAPI